MDSAYRLPAHSGEAVGENATVPARAQRGSVITSLPVKSIIATPSDGSVIDSAAASVRVFGAAWAGTSSVAHVEISTDSGKSWQPAALGSEHARYTWRFWDFEWKPPEEGAYVVLSRAADDRGRSQPIEMRWTPRGYVSDPVARLRAEVG